MAGPKIPVKIPVASLDRLDKALAKAADDQGGVSVGELDRRLEVTAEVNGKSAGTEKALAAVEDKFAKTETRWVSSGCSSSAETVRVAAKLLSASQVHDVREALADAKARVASFDTTKADGTQGKDGVLSPEEAEAALARTPRGLADKLAQAAVEGAVKDATPKPRPVTPTTTTPAAEGSRSGTCEWLNETCSSWSASAPATITANG